MRNVAGASPYATGGGGVTFERRVAAWYLALLLTGETAPELGDSRHVSHVSFQQAPRAPVDDIVVRATRAGNDAPDLQLAIGARRQPKIVRSNEDTQKLIVDFVRALQQTHDDGLEHRLGLAVSGVQTHTSQLDELAAHARMQRDASEFFDLLQTPKRFKSDLVDRLSHVEDLVKYALVALGTSTPPTDLVSATTWRLLRTLEILPLRLEEPDTADWAAMQNRLVSVASGRDLSAAGNLRDRVESLAGQYAPQAATVDATMLRRDTHALLNGSKRHVQGWALLDQLSRLTRDGVRHQVGTGDAKVTLDRRRARETVLAEANGAGALVISGDSGVGKSSLALAAIEGTAADADGEAQAVFLGLRQLPETWTALLQHLGAPLEAVLDEMSAPRRYLVVDAAESAAESRRDVFAYLIDAAKRSGVQLIAVVQSEVRQVIHDQIAERLGADQIGSYEVDGLDDEEIDQIVEAFPTLRRLAQTPRSRALLRRLVVVDLLLRSEGRALPLSDAEAMREVWGGLVRRQEQRDRGLPDAREQVMMRLAAHALRGGAAPELEASALDGLRQDGLLRSVQGNPWQVVPEFTHDEIRRYAVARVLLASSDGLGDALITAGAPRWALSSATLAAQTVLLAGDATVDDDPLQELQAQMDAVATAGHGSRWADVPAEAVLSLGDSTQTLTQAWSTLRGGDGSGLARLLRVLDQRHRSRESLLDQLAARPVIALLLDEPAPWRISEEVTVLIGDWLRSLVFAQTPAGDPLRERLREILNAYVTEAQTSLDAARTAEAQTRIDRGEQAVEEPWSPFDPPPDENRRRRLNRRMNVPQPVRDETTVELWALLGPDLGDEGERALRRLAEDAPASLGPALEELGTGVALASYRCGLLADLVEAYYIDDEDVHGSSLMNDGIRHHRFSGVDVPLMAWYRGPFMALFQTDFVNGVKVLNRLLNHAARKRASTLAGLGDRWYQPSQADIDQYGAELAITGEARRYVGDAHVWRWYRGTGVGPYPCMSALQALELVCDQLLTAPIRVERLIETLLDDCENLAMPGLVVGVIVRHLESAGTLLDPFLSEPLVWHLEFTRVVGEHSSLSSGAGDVVNAHGRAWSLRDAAMWLTVSADEARANELRRVGEQLVARATKPTGAQGGEHPTDQPAGDIAMVRAWASTLDSNTYTTEQHADGVVVQSTPSQDIVDVLEAEGADPRKANEIARLQLRYIRANDGRPSEPLPTPDELRDDLATARELVAAPPATSAISTVEMAAAIAAYALGVLLTANPSLDEAARQFVVDVVLEIAEEVPDDDGTGDDSSHYAIGADRSAARAVPLLLLPNAADLLELAATESGSGEQRVSAAGLQLARSPTGETRLYLARGLDPVWRTPCSPQANCHHREVMRWATETMRTSVLGKWAHGTRAIERLRDPIAESLSATPDADIYASRLDAGIRALGVAATEPICVQSEARQLLDELLFAQRRSVLAHEEDYDDRGSSALVAARALLLLANEGDDQPLHDHIAAYAVRSSALSSLLNALAAAAEETPAAADTARRLWPAVIEQVLAFAERTPSPFSDHYYGAAALDALAPHRASDIGFLYRELGTSPVEWRDPLGWSDALDAWIEIATGRPSCIDALIWLVDELPIALQLQFALPRVARLAETDIEAAATRSYVLSKWLIELRNAGPRKHQLASWQQLVDALVVAGDRRLAPYSQ